eukprot:TRINITY_DN2095_c0_g1_i1.p1 TRINITY_DN2095_c0_g1~~TRINITY_DN2095_c0_g1_i1.p1  ORF type:complete len:289 (-),score=82.85 TRINITY_DN2095_c0_g1_i1:169-906(-)
MASQEMCFYCFDVVVSNLEGSSMPNYSFENKEEFPLFVTWMKDDGKENSSLRGCIGTFSPTSLQDGLKQFAISSAFKDKRFSPIKIKEIPKLRCGVSLLTNFEEAEDVWDWEIGKHGIYITFHDGLQKRTATYLPEVALEQGWTKVEAIDSLINKAGYHGKVNNHFREKIQLTRYQSSKCWATYTEYYNFCFEKKTKEKEKKLNIITTIQHKAEKSGEKETLEKLSNEKNTNEKGSEKTGEKKPR